jgi:hypothetical protein
MANVSEDLPDAIRQLVRRCWIGEHTFDNDDMSVALKFGELLWHRINRMAEHYDRQSGNFMPNDIRGPMMVKAATDMRHVLADTLADLPNEKATSKRPDTETDLRIEFKKEKLNG